MTREVALITMWVTRAACAVLTNRIYLFEMRYRRMLTNLHVLTGADAEEYIKQRAEKSIAIGIEKGVAEEWARISLNVRNEMVEQREPIDRESVTKVS